MQRLRWAGGALLDRGLRSPSMWRSSALAAASALRLEVLGVRHLIQLGLHFAGKELRGLPQRCALP